MPTGYGTIYNDGVKYLKINKFDANGTDKSDYLAQMTSIRINHGDVGTLQYNISTTQVQNDYFIFGLTYPQPTTSSIGDINNYTFAASSSFGYNISQSFSLTGYCINYTNTSGNTLGYFTASSGLYTFGQTPNPELNINIQCVVSNPNVGAPKTLRFYILSVNKNDERPTFFIDQPVNSGSFGFSLNFTNINPTYCIENDSLAFGVYEVSGVIATPIVLNTFKVTLSQTQTTFNGSSSLVIFDPDTINFDYNDYNPLLGNAETPQYSTTWMDVDYSQNPLTPVNFGLIISGTADRAFVQDSNYSSKAWSNLRYNGSRTNSYRTT
jgi:hypothetical protein